MEESVHCVSVCCRLVGCQDLMEESVHCVSVCVVDRLAVRTSWRSLSTV